MTDTPLRVNIIVPSMGTWETDFGMCLCGMIGNFWADNTWPYKDRDIRLQSTVGSLLANNRQGALKRAIELGMTHALFIDSDQTFPQHLLRQLLSWKMPVVGCNVATKMMPSSPTVRMEGNKPLYTTPYDSGLVRVWRMGTGIMLIDLSVLSKVPYPWFGSRWEPAQDKNVGEDWFFCEQLEAAGVPIFVDQGLSMEIGHVGKWNYDHWAVPVPKEDIDEKGFGNVLSAGNHVVLNGGTNAQKSSNATAHSMGLRSSAYSKLRRRRGNR